MAIMPTTQTILHGISLEKLKDFPDDHFDSCVTDPPYGLRFMNKHWDYDVPKLELWKEVYRVMKPGAHILVACGTRTQHRMAVNIEDAGFQIRDVISWIYGSGFPKSLNIAMAIDKQSGTIGHRGKAFVTAGAGERKDIQGTQGGEEMAYTDPITDAAKQWAGWGTALKPATEFWTLARKPLSEATIAQNVLRHGTGGLNIDGSRIGFASDADRGSAVWGRGSDILGGNYVGGTHSSGKENIEPNQGGRFPANLILSHHPDCVCTGTKKVKGTFTSNGDAAVGEASAGVITPMRRGTGIDRTDEDGLETVEAWQCVEDCPVRMMDQQAPQAGAYAPVAARDGGKTNNVFGVYAENGDDGRSFHDSGNLGGASRFFYCAKADGFERNKGLKDFDKAAAFEYGSIKKSEGRTGINTPRANNHPTVKPIDLMRYLVKLITPKGGHVLDPFNGSGTTGIAAKLELMNYTGIEMDEQYCKISEARIAAWNPDRDKPQTFF